MVGDFDQFLSFGDVDGVDLDAVRPVGDSEFKGPGVDGAGEGGAGGLWGDKEVGGARGDVGEDPVEAADSVADEDAVGGQVAEGDGDGLAGVAEFDAGGSEERVRNNELRWGVDGKTYDHQETYLESQRPL